MTNGLDSVEFWRENALCADDWLAEKPRLRLQLSIGEDICKSVAGVTDHPRFYNDYCYQQEIRRTASAIMEREIGLSVGPTIYSGSVICASLYGGEVVYPQNAPPWIRPVINDVGDIAPVIGRAERIDPTEAGIFPRWLEWRARIEEEEGVSLALGGACHGPATMAAMLCGTTNYLLLMQDYPDWMRALYESIRDVEERYMRAMRLLTGQPLTGLGMGDDDSALLSPTLFAEFEYPVLDHWYSAFCPERGHQRYFHSDGNMTHLLTFLHELRISDVNLGPAISARRIRAEMPNAVLHGHVPPLLLRNGTPEAIAQRVRDDFCQAGRDGRMVVTTAGSINEGTPLGNLRALMAAVQEHCRLDGGSLREECP